MADMALSGEQMQQLEAGLASLQSAGGPGGVDAAAFDIGSIVGSAQTEFCAIWPKAKPILELVAKYIRFIPGVGSTASAIIAGLIVGGNALAAAVCAKP